MLEGKIRESNKKAYTKKLRSDGYLIANIYGKGFENINAYFNANDFIKFVKNKEDVYFDIKIDKKELKVVIREVQTHPVKNDILHVDLMLAQKDLISKYKVPVRTKGQAIGLKNKGLLLINQKRIKVKCKVEDLPKEFLIDVSELDVGNSVLVKDLIVPKNVLIDLEPRISVLSVIKAG